MTPRRNASQPDRGPESLNAAEVEIERLHAELSETLQRLAWAILRDWHLAADAVQDAFGLFTQKFEEIPREHARGWLVKAVQFQSQNLRRKHKRTSVCSDLVQEELEQLAKVQPSAAAKVEDLQKALVALPEAQRTVVLRRLVDGQTFSEIANDLEIPLGTVLSRMRLALQKLRNEMHHE